MFMWAKWAKQLVLEALMFCLKQKMQPTNRFLIKKGALL